MNIQKNRKSKIIQKNLVYIKKWVSAELKFWEIWGWVMIVMHVCVLTVRSYSISVWENGKERSKEEKEMNGNILLSSKMRWVSRITHFRLFSISHISCNLSTKLLMRIEGELFWTAFDSTKTKKRKNEKTKKR